MMALTAGFAALALVVSGVPAFAVARFGLLVALGFYLPGSLLAPRELDRHPAAAVAFSLGLVVAGLFWAGSLWLGLPPRLSFLALGALAVGALVRGSWRLPPGPSRGLAAVVVACTLSVAWTQFGDGRFVSGGGMRFTGTYAPEALFHSAIAQELRHHLPVELPAGATLPYHVGYNLLAALTAEATGANMLDVNYRLLPLLLVPLAVLSAVAFAESLGARHQAALAGALFLFFADDLSWVFGTSGAGDPGSAGGRSWNFLLGAPLLYALHHNRGFLAGIALLFPALIVAARYLRDGRREDLAAAALLVGALIELKVSFFLTVAPAIAAAAVGVALTAEASRAMLLGRGAAVTMAASALAAPLAMTMIGESPGGYSGFVWAPGEAGILPLVRLRAVGGDPVSGAPAGEVGLVARFLGLILLALGSLGVRGLGLFAFFGPRWRGEPGAWLAAATVAVGAAAAILVVTPPARLNTIYFWGTSLAVLAVLAGVAADQALGRASPRRRVAGVAMLALVALPGTLQMLWVERSVRAPAVLKAARGTEDIVRALSRQARPGDVLLEPPPAGFSLLAAMVAVRPVIAWPEWIANTLGQEAVRARLDDAGVFFSAADPTRREAMLNRYRVRWVWAPLKTDCPPLPRFSLAATSAAGRLFAVEPRR